MLEASIQSLSQPPLLDQNDIDDPSTASPWVPFGDVELSISHLPPGHQQSPFMKQTGFEIGLVHTTGLTQSEIGDVYSGIVHRKDRPGNDLLLITAGGPDLTGCLHPAEERYADLLMERVPQITPRHIKRVLLHRWYRRDVLELLPHPGPANWC